MFSRARRGRDARPTAARTFRTTSRAIAREIPLARFLDILRANIPSHLSRDRGTSDLALIRRHFGSRSGLSARISPYHRQIRGVLEPRASLGRVVDLGCGRAPIHALLREENVRMTSYLGIDAAIEDRVLGGHDRVIRGDVLSGRTRVHRCDTLIAVNLLCFCPDLGAIPLLSGSARTLLIVEPYPSLFWERHVCGIALTGRRPQALAEALGKHGWVADHLHTTWIRSVAFRPIGRFSYAARFVREP